MKSLIYDKIRLGGGSATLPLRYLMGRCKGKVACFNFRRNGAAARTVGQSMGYSGCRRKSITVKFQKKSYHATADANGRWSITLPPLKAGGPFPMQVNDIKLNDILVGDVWLCSGQSNMELPVRRVMDMFSQ